MTFHTNLWDVPADPHHVGVVRREVASFAAGAGMERGALADMQVAVSDALTNSVIGADRASGAGARVRVEAEAQDGELLIRVSDSGPGLGARAGAAVAGLHLTMIAALAQVFAVRRSERGGTELNMTFALGA